MNFWAVKSEPEAYSWSHLVKDGKTAWTGVRNYQARNNLRAMKKGDVLCFYHSGEGKEIVGLARVVKEAYADPTAEEGDWSCLDIEPVKPLKTSVSLATMKADKTMKEMLLVKHSRISVTPVTKEQFARLLILSETTI